MDWWIAIQLPGGNDLAYLDSEAAAEFGEEARFRYSLDPLSTNLVRVQWAGSFAWTPYALWEG